MKVLTQKFFISTMVMTLMLVSSLAGAANTNKVLNSRHNFGYSGGSNEVSPQYGGPINEVCKYCHTPHNSGGPSKYLWNKANDLNATYIRYTSSRTLHRGTVVTTFTADSPSLLCLGCHDGKTAINVMHTGGAGADVGSILGDQTYAPGVKFTVDGAGPIRLGNMPAVPDEGFGGSRGSQPNIGRDASSEYAGKNLADDHPVGFSYDTVLSQNSAGLNSVAQVGVKSSNKIRFFGTDNRLECSSCHNPHREADPDTMVSNYFLAMDNDGSGLCLSCHNK